VVGWVGNAIFASRFIVQWYATEKRKQVSVPAAFWWLSLAGALILLTYAIFHDKDSVWIFAYAFTWIPYIRNLIIHYRHERAQQTCAACGVLSPPSAKFCAQCGESLRENQKSLNLKA
jgi:lipid-A-disaccharide synthase-like uncharacterized protein